MSFMFRCPRCGRKLESEDEWEGQEACCPVCNSKIIITRNISSSPAVSPPRATAPVASVVPSGKVGPIRRENAERILSRYKINCPNCGGIVEVMRNQVGMKADCSHCRRPFTVPRGLLRKAGLAAFKAGLAALKKAEEELNS